MTTRDDITPVAFKPKYVAPLHIPPVLVQDKETHHINQRRAILGLPSCHLTKECLSLNSLTPVVANCPHFGVCLASKKLLLIK